MAILPTFCLGFTAPQTEMTVTRVPPAGGGSNWFSCAYKPSYRCNESPSPSPLRNDARYTLSPALRWRKLPSRFWKTWKHSNSPPFAVEIDPIRVCAFFETIRRMPHHRPISQILHGAANLTPSQCPRSIRGGPKVCSVRLLVLYSIWIRGHSFLVVFGIASIAKCSCDTPSLLAVSSSI